VSQAIQISELTGKLVFCTENMEIIKHRMIGRDLQKNIMNSLPDKNIAMQAVNESSEQKYDRFSTRLLNNFVKNVICSLMLALRMVPIHCLPLQQTKISELLLLSR